MPVDHLNPEGLVHNPAFSHGVVVDAPSTTIYVGGQNGVDADGKVVGDDLASQARQAFANVAVVLRSAGASMDDIVQWTISVVDGQPIQDGFAAFQEAWDAEVPPPALSVNVVAGLANPAFLCEITAIAAL